MRCRFCDSLPIPSHPNPSHPISTINKSNDCWMSYVDVLKWPEICKFFRYFHRSCFESERLRLFVFRLQAISDVFHLEVFGLCFPECLMCAMCDGNGQADRVWWDLLSVDLSHLITKAMDHLNSLYFPRCDVSCFASFFDLLSHRPSFSKQVKRTNKCPLPITEWMTSYHAAFVCFFVFDRIDRRCSSSVSSHSLSLSLCICCRSWILFVFHIYYISGFASHFPPVIFVHVHYYVIDLF